MQQLSEKFFILVIVMLFFGVLHLLAPILSPFLMGALLAYLVNPLVKQFVAFKVPRLLSIIITFAILFGVIVLLFLLVTPLIEEQIITLVNLIPGMIVWLKTTFHLDSEAINIDAIKTVLTENWDKAGGIAAWLFKTMLHSGMRFVAALMNLILVPVVTFYLLCDWSVLLQGLRNTLPRHLEPTVVKLVVECHEVLSAFFRGQLLVMLVLCVVYAAGLAAVGLQIGLLIGLTAGILSIVPYLGFTVGIIAASIAAFMQFGMTSAMLLVWLVFLIAHVIDNVFLTPKLVGNRIGLHPVAVIFAVLAGGSLFGFVGVLLALPVAALIMVWVRYFYKSYQDSKLYQS
ncbi:MAG: hypothetical protein A3E83_07785 [Gammaproteobacteria bacterium RIFCSPHIGHO2_12_FULL_41_20]|nr:MAG: hypothetical protein A3E83_07785 [Gammaproteobacteria bacterium RIFCSPHIGHO2_12_FULL_41_20]